MSRSEAEECVVFIKNKVSDSNEYSELYGRLTWVGYDLKDSIPSFITIQSFGIIGGLSSAIYKRTRGYWYFYPKWTKNDLDLIFEERMVGPTKVIDVNFRNQEPEGTINGLQNLDIKRR